MRIVGLPEIAGAVQRASAAVAPAQRIAASQKSAAQTRESEAPVSTARVTAGDRPVDHDRVAEIRKALQDNRYPIIPTEIADAIIAAGLYGTISK
ncbi:MAG: flagellar biosynthesis anti-sigma factor FlgM [Alphaproteobacteria bacterium]|jgi:negative regulator of flagellin synthesis FlgM|nr:flagellar biosynthesis anti-sigma factor FlgM [Alphaproteobacteria bacterium]MBU1756737.1 flagellar biosynthesis anti-sigma factor FlgM [Alphaproteobacteria bacterium]